MEKEKFLTSSKNDRQPRKTSLQTEKKLVKSKIKKKSNLNNKTEANEFDMDSLEYLRDSTKKKKLSGIDEKIKLLKTELKTLLSDKGLDKISDYSLDAVYDSRNSDLKHVHNFNQLKPAVSVSDCIKSKENYEDFKYLHNKKPISTSTPFKLSERAKETVKTEIFVETLEQKFSDAKDLYLNSNTCVDITTEAKSQIFNVSLLSQEKVEQLLYKSFVIQNTELNLAHSKKSNSEQKTSAINTNNKKFRRSKKKCKDYNKKFNQQNLSKYCKSTQRGRKRRMISINSSLSDVEVVHLDSSSCNNIDPRNDTTCVELNIKDYDWNEPFDVNIAEFPSELKTSDRCEKKGNNENQELELNNFDLKETEISCNDGNEESLSKRIWECPVCFEQSKGQEVVATKCGHVFCKKCLENHFSKLGQSCPSCRAILKNKPFITLFNF